MSRVDDGRLHGERLVALRGELTRRRLDGFVVPLTDEHLSEHIGAHASRLAWLTGFKGSVASAVVLQKAAAIFVDGRYVLQVRRDIDTDQWQIGVLPQTTLVGWLCERAGVGTRIGFDPALHAAGWVEAIRSALAAVRSELVEVTDNPVDAVWFDQPAPSSAKILVHPEQLAGRSSGDKRRAMARALIAAQADVVVLTKLDSIAWTFNTRGSDVQHTPVALANAIVRADGTADLFVAPVKVDAAVAAHLGPEVRVHAQDRFGEHLKSLAGSRVAVDPERTPFAIYMALRAAGASIVQARDPAVLPKAIKNPAEIAGHRAAQLRDGAALTRFLHWFTKHAPGGELTEVSAAAQLREFRAATGELRDLAFETISAFGPNGAIVHYHPTRETNRRIAPDGLYLVDSGGQYRDGTTDITRTLAVGLPSAEMRDRFTRVLQGHIALAQIVFPAGTCGGQIDAIARQHLWAAGVDYEHGTGHGVGAYLDVHEGPQRISRTGDCSEPLVPGMIVSNEPGYYKAGEFGIRIENLQLVVERDIADASAAMLGFETLSFAPIERNLIEIAMLTRAERAWLDAYHAEVARLIGPRLEGAARAWLVAATRPLALVGN